MNHSVLRPTSVFGGIQGIDMYLLLLFFFKLYATYDNAVHVPVKVLVPSIIKYFTSIIIIFPLLT